ncbi:hypothetical protein DPMN_126242 [Dreissena polymorpha]|uniref:Uncharacterized protein n=1 Tax=Dreissena polymorpha TaxID=45954 RepID=A0A9D4JUA3_DREPO|nr:hypothetical protein DPMN_126242 [Dreissena polymorpha]
MYVIRGIKVQFNFQNRTAKGAQHALHQRDRIPNETASTFAQRYTEMFTLALHLTEFGMLDIGTSTVMQLTRFFMCSGLYKRGPRISPNIWNKNRNTNIKIKTDSLFWNV